MRYTRLMQICFAALALTAAGMFVLNARAASVDELQRQIDAKNEEIKKIQTELLQYNDQLATTQQESDTLKNKISQLNANIAYLRNRISLTEAQIDQKNLEVRELDILITGKEVSIDERTQAIAGLMRSLAQRQASNPLVALLVGGSLSQFFDSIEQQKNVQQELHTNLLALQNEKQGLEDSQSAAEQKKKQLASYQSSLADQQVIIQGQKNEHQALLAHTQNQEKKYQQLVSDTEQRYEDIQREIDSLENQLRAQVDPSSLPPPKKGYFDWPVVGRISQGYGQTAFSRYSHYYTFHNGIDIAAGVGTPVQAPADGTVVAIGNSDAFCPWGAYGKFIVIDHGDNLMTLYGHLSLQKVSAGQHVLRGDVIGYTGMTGRTTGPHLHFTVYDGRTFELRGTNFCGILPFGGSLNPLTYL